MMRLMNMKTALILLLGLAMHAEARLHELPEYKVSMELPDDWEKDERSHFGYNLKPPGQVGGIKIHLRSPNEKSLLEALNGLVQRLAWNASKKDAKTRDRVIEVVERKDSKGRLGLRVTSGVMDGDQPLKEAAYRVCHHYLFLNSEGKAVCVCLFRTSGIHDPEEADQLILPNLTIQ